MTNVNEAKAALGTARSDGKDTQVSSTEQENEGENASESQEGEANGMASGRANERNGVSQDVLKGSFVPFQFQKGRSVCKPTPLQKKLGEAIVHILRLERQALR